MTTYRVHMSHFLSTSVVQGVRRFWLSGLSCLALVGCSSGLTPHIGGVSAEKVPHEQVADYLSTTCDELWTLDGTVAENNPLYWLRGMDCAERLTPTQARAQANQLGDESWSDAFKRGVLLANAKITPSERQLIVSRLDAKSAQIPTRIRPLYQVWRDNQMLQLKLSDQRTRYSKLQETSDAALDELRQQQQALKGELDLTTRKLQNLTDIERQLSSRKPSSGFNPDSTHGTDTPADSEEKQ
ncbi:two-component system QseEF-associated lipoprotein QseG [Pseudocitrobacter faecalis]|uniref:two-component system QseEF-associated lipoprotein QseG n=1 Tax=Pseudocitrobacter faecalis TaxID=1398493 RepID=UPI0024CBCF8F|nr:two-component system QseEF-associated lipoprotein QseG [Pseudocitrobacter faecalis]